MYILWLEMWIFFPNIVCQALLVTNDSIYVKICCHSETFFAVWGKYVSPHPNGFKIFTIYAYLLYKQQMLHILKHALLHILLCTYNITVQYLLLLNWVIILRKPYKYIVLLSLILFLYTSFAALCLFLSYSSSFCFRYQQVFWISPFSQVLLQCVPFAI